MTIQNFTAHKGYFITFEGGEGTGKSSQIAHLMQRLKQLNIPITLTREPGGVPSAEKIRQLLVTSQDTHWDNLTETLLQFAARRENYLKCIQPALQRNEWVICDRFIDSTFAYQGSGQGVKEETLEQLSQLTLNGFKPDLTIVLDVAVATGLERSRRRLQNTGCTEDRFEKMDEPFHQRIQNAFRNIVQKNPDRCFLIDANLSFDSVSNHIWTVVQQRCAFPLAG